MGLVVRVSGVRAMNSNRLANRNVKSSHFDLIQRVIIILTTIDIDEIWIIDY